jgi:hypothetical protein
VRACVRACVRAWFWQETSRDRLNETCCAVASSVPGTHKSNLRGPASLYSYGEHQDLVFQEDCKAGDVMIFTEVCLRRTITTPCWPS